MPPRPEFVTVLQTLGCTHLLERATQRRQRRLGVLRLGQLRRALLPAAAEVALVGAPQHTLHRPRGAELRLHPLRGGEPATRAGPVCSFYSPGNGGPDSALLQRLRPARNPLTGQRVFARRGEGQARECWRSDGNVHGPPWSVQCCVKQWRGAPARLHGVENGCVARFALSWLARPRGGMGRTCSRPASVGQERTASTSTLSWGDARAGSVKG